MTLSPLVASAVGKATYYHATCPSVKAVRQHAEAFDKMLRLLEATAPAGNSSKTKRLTNTILKSYSARLTCFVLSHNGKLLNGMTMEQMAEQLDMYHSLKEPVRVKLETKSNGKSRPIVMPGVMRLAAQTLCARVMLAQGMRWDFDYLAPKRSTACAVENLVKLSKEENHEWFVTADVKDCYPSLKLQNIKDHLNLPEDVVRNIIFIDDKSPVLFESSIPHTDHEMLGQVVREGLPQGSPASGVAASWLVGKMLFDIGASDRCTLFGDDMAVAACSEAKAKAINDALLLAAHNHTCGPLALKHHSYRHIEAGFSYLGYRVRRLNNTDELTYTIHPCAESLRKFKKKYAHLAISDQLAADEYADQWKNAFPAWKPTELGEILFEMTKFEAVDGAKKDKNHKAV